MSKLFFKIIHANPISNPRNLRNRCKSAIQTDKNSEKIRLNISGSYPVLTFDKIFTHPEFLFQNINKYDTIRAKSVEGGNYDS